MKIQVIVKIGTKTSITETFYCDPTEDQRTKFLKAILNLNEVFKQECIKDRKQ